MVTEGCTPRLAVLIDADNISYRLFPQLFLRINKIGHASVRWAYGNSSVQMANTWKRDCSTHTIEQKPVARTPGKNATDIALVIGAMDLLHTNRFDGFCLVSSDRDFTGLAQRIRDQGVDVYGFGEEKTPDPYRAACSEFVCLQATPEKLLVHAHASQPDVSKTHREAIEIIREAIENLESDDNGWVRLSNVSNKLGKGFAPNHKLGPFGKFVGKQDVFEVRKAKTAGMELRIKPPGQIPDRG